MSSTYTLNNGIELIGTGEQSGTWGATTNTNFELLDTALDGQVTITASSAGTQGSPNSLPVSDGAASNGRNRLVNIRSDTDLGSIVYYQLTPSDAEKIIYIRNSLNAQSLIVFQGTYNASNDYEIPNGKTAIIFFNGAGSGAVAANVMSNAHFDALNIVGNASVGGTLAVTSTSTFSDDVTFTGASYNVVWDKSDNALEFADNAKAVFGAGSDLQIYHDGNSKITDVGDGKLELHSNGTGVTIQKGATEYMAQFLTDGAVQLYYDNASKLATTATGVAITGGATFSGTSNFGDGNELRFGADNDLAIFHSSGVNNIRSDLGTLKLRSDDMRFTAQNGTSEFARFDSSGNFGIGVAAPTGILSISGADTTSKPQLRFMTGEGTGLADAALSTTDDSGGTGLLIGSNLYYSGGSITRFSTSRSGAAIDFGYTGSMKFYTGSGNTAPDQKMTLDSSGNLQLTSVDQDIEFNATTGAHESRLKWNYGGTLQSWIEREHSDGSMVFGNQGSERMRIDSEGRVGIGVVPAAIADSTGVDSLQLGGSFLSHFDEDGSGSIILGNNIYYNGTANKALFDGYTSQYYQAGGTHVWRNSGITSAGSTATMTESMRIESGGDVGINITDPVVKLHVKDPDSVVAGLQSDATYAWLAFDASGTSGSVLDANVGIGANGNDLKFRSGGATRLTLDASGNLVFPNGNGIDFSASAGGGASSSLLDDYEEGTWTPSVGGATTDPTVTYTTQAGFYVKIGRMVHISMYLNCTAVSGGSGAAKINGIPFNANNAGSYFGGSQMEIFGLNIPSDYNNVFLRVNGNSGHFRLEFVNTKASSTGGTGAGVGTGDLANNFRVLGSFTYMTS